MSTATTSAPRRASSALIAPVPQPASSTRMPRRSSGRRDSISARMRSRPSRTVWRMRLTFVSAWVSCAQAFVAVRSKYCSTRSRVRL